MPVPPSQLARREIAKPTEIFAHGMSASALCCRQFQYAVAAASVRCSEGWELPLKPLEMLAKLAPQRRPEMHLAQISLLFSLLAGK
jgi:hypothetical protein